MLHQARGIVLHHIRYSETSVIARIYTDKFGLQSYLIRGVGSQKAKIKLGLLEHLSLLEMVVYYRDGKSLQTIKELRPAHIFRSLHSDIRKSSQALFINEVVYKSVKEEESNEALFGFLYNSVLDLDEPGAFSPSFHLSFLLQLSRLLGFAPRPNYFNGAWFNLREGVFEPNHPGHTETVAPEFSGYLHDLMQNSISGNNALSIPGAARGMLLNKLIEFYKLHLPNFSGLNSPAVLHEVLSG